MRRHDPFLWPLLVGRDAPWMVADAGSDPASWQAARLGLPPNGRLILVHPSGGLRHAARAIAEAGFVEERRAVLRFDESSGAVSSALVLERQPPVLERLATACRARLHRDGWPESAGDGTRRRRLRSCRNCCDVRDQNRPAAVTVHRGSGGTFRAMTESAVARLPSVAAAVPRFEANQRARSGWRAMRGRSRFRGSWPQGRMANSHARSRRASPTTARLPAGVGPDARACRRVGAAALAAFQRGTVRHAFFGDGISSVSSRARRATRAVAGCKRAHSAGLYVERRPVVRERIIPLVFMHGDFKVGNLLWSGQDQVCGVVDWDLSAPEGFPVVDYAFYLAFDRSVTRSRPFAECMAALVGARRGRRKWDLPAPLSRPRDRRPALRRRRDHGPGALRQQSSRSA